MHENTLAACECFPRTAAIMRVAYFCQLATVLTIAIAAWALASTPARGQTPAQSDTCTITGTQSAEVIQGTPGRDVICGLGGNDTILGGGGNDLLVGGSGNDRMSGGAGGDELLGGAGSDVLHGGSGDDELWGGAGGDYLDGDLGLNPCFGGTADDFAQRDVLILDGCEDAVPPKITYVRIGPVQTGTNEAVVTLRLVDDLAGLQTDPFEAGNVSASACWFQFEAQSPSGGWTTGSCLVFATPETEDNSVVTVASCVNPAQPSTDTFACFGVFPDQTPLEREEVRINRIIDGRILDATFRITVGIPNFVAKCGPWRFMNEREASPVVRDATGNTRTYLYAGTPASVVSNDSTVAVWPGAGPSGLQCPG